MIAVIGSGAFGTALAISLAASHQTVVLWSHRPDHAAEMQQHRENRRRLANVPLPENLVVTASLDDIADDAICLLAVPMQQLRALLDGHADQLRQPALVACCKGMELSTGLGPVQILERLRPASVPAILTGPSFARDIATGLPTALTLACADAAMGETLQSALNTPTLRVYRTADTIGAELGGALKNVMAIACGAAIGAGLGESARAALMTRGYAEMQRIAAALGARSETLLGLSGFGDLVLTCTSEQSRNYLFGLSIGRRSAFDATVTVEGAATARAMAQRAVELGVDMPITNAVVALIDGKLHVEAAMDMLLSRPLKEE